KQQKSCGDESNSFHVYSPTEAVDAGCAAPREIAGGIEPCQRRSCGLTTTREVGEDARELTGRQARSVGECSRRLPIGAKGVPHGARQETKPAVDRPPRTTMRTASACIGRWFALLACGTCFDAVSGPWRCRLPDSCRLSAEAGLANR